MVHQLRKKYGTSWKKFFKGVNRVRQMHLQSVRGELEAMKMNDLEDISNYITRVQIITGETLTDVRIVEKIL